MNASKRIAVITGVLFIVGMAAGILSVVPAIEDPDYLVKAAANEDQVVMGAFFQFIMAAAYVGIATLLYPILGKRSKGLAFGFAGFRIIAGVLNIIGIVILLLLLTLSQEFVRAGTPNSSHFQTLGVLMREGRDLVNHVAMILALSLGGLMFYYALYKTGLVPRWLSGWGLVGTALTILASLLLMFRLIGVMTTIYLALNIPMALQEMLMSIWLIVRGFNPSAIASEPARKE